MIAIMSSKTVKKQKASAAKAPAKAPAKGSCKAEKPAAGVKAVPAKSAQKCVVKPAAKAPKPKPTVGAKQKASGTKAVLKNSSSGKSVPVKVASSKPAAAKSAPKNVSKAKDSSGRRVLSNSSAGSKQAKGSASKGTGGGVVKVSVGRADGAKGEPAKPKLSVKVKGASGEKSAGVSKKSDSPKEVEVKRQDSKKAEQKKQSQQAEAPLSGLKLDEPEMKKKGKNRGRVRHSESIYFTLEDLDAYFKDKAAGLPVGEQARKETGKSEKKSVGAPKVPKAKKVVQSFDAASIADILGFNPVEAPTREKHIEKEIPRKWKKYYSMLVQLRKKHSEGVSERSEEVLKRSAKEDSGDLSSYGQHLADAGSESFDRDMAFSLLSSEHEIIHEIDAAIERMKKGVYGICEYTGAPIPAERLESIPFTRYTKEGQERKELELKRAKSMQWSGFGDMGADGSGGEEEHES